MNLKEMKQNLFQEYPFRIELHAHSKPASRCSDVSPEELVDIYHEAGYDAICLTNHFLTSLMDRGGIELFLEDYERAQKQALRYGMLVYLCAELRFDEMINDYLLYGLNADFFYNAPRLNELESLQDLRALLPSQACIVQAHPFRNGMVVQSPEMLTGIEVFNGGTDRFRNSLARQFAEHYCLAKTSGSDIHGIDALAKGGIVTDRRIRTTEDLSAVLRSGDYGLIEP